MSISPFDHPLLAALFGDEHGAAAFSLEAEIDAMLAFELALAEAEAEEGVIEPAAAQAVAAAIAAFAPDFDALRTGVARDGVVVPELVRQIRDGMPVAQRASLHYGATSQDAIDTGLVLRLRPVLSRMDAGLAELVGRLGDLDERFGERGLTGVTRMQRAIPLRAADRIAEWSWPLQRHRARLGLLAPALSAVQFGGAAGTLEKLGDRGAAVRAGLARRLGLADAPQWHSQRDAVAEFGGWLSLVTGSLGKFGQDVGLMALAGGEIELTGRGGSSAMPYKQNPVAAEVLVALARFNAVQVSGLHQATVHEFERSGAAWALEWLILPQMVAATAGALRLANQLAAQVESFGV